jgi:uncharacterized protein YbbK (DUF523 family)
MRATIMASAVLIGIVPAGAQERLPEITVQPSNPYEVMRWPEESDRVQEWIDYCKPTLSTANADGIRHYLFKNHNPACGSGATMK